MGKEVRVWIALLRKTDLCGVTSRTYLEYHCVQKNKLFNIVVLGAIITKRTFSIHMINEERRGGWKKIS
jgi:hypothetical protein